MTRLIYLWHRRLALLLLIPVLVFSLSGLLHPAMRLLRVEPAQMFYPAPQWPDNLPGFSEPLIGSLPEQLAGMRPVKIGDQWLIQTWIDRQQASEFYQPDTGLIVSDAARRYAIQLARHYSGDTDSPVTRTELVTHFGHGYNPTNRLLPVWKVSFQRDDQLQVYVDIRNDRLATLSDSTRMQLMQLFRWLHVWSFIDETSNLRHGLFIAMMAASTLLGAAGIWLFVVLPISKRKRTNARTIHSWGGILVSIALLMFTVSGLIRTTEKITPEVRGLSLNHQIAPQSLRYGFDQLQQRYSVISDVRLQSLNGNPAWQILMPRQAAIWVDAVSGLPLADGELRFATELVGSLLPEYTSPDGFKTVSNYKSVADYGFIDKRLPVTGLSYGADTVYVDSRDQVASKVSTPISRSYSWVFRYLHKWRFADGLGLNGRDGLISLFILMISGISILGLWIWLKKRFKRKQRQSLPTPEITFRVPNS